MSVLSVHKAGFALQKCRSVCSETHLETVVLSHMAYEMSADVKEDKEAPHPGMRRE